MGRGWGGLKIIVDKVGTLMGAVDLEHHMHEVLLLVVS